MRTTNWDDELLEAARNGDLIKVQKALENGANPNVKDKDGHTPLHLAAFTGHADVARLLLEHGADPNFKNNIGHTPLHIAAFTGHADVVRVLLERGADPRIADNKGHIPLDYAKDSAIRSLLESAMRNNKSRNGRRLKWLRF